MILQAPFFSVFFNRSTRSQFPGAAKHADRKDRKCKNTKTQKKCKLQREKECPEKKSAVQNGSKKNSPGSAVPAEKFRFRA